MEVCRAFVVFAFITLALVAKPGAFGEEVFAVVVDRAFNRHALVFSADMWRFSVRAVRNTRAFNWFAFVAFANFLIFAIGDALAFRYVAAVCFDVLAIFGALAWVVAGANFVWFAVKIFHARDGLAGLISAAAFAILAIFFSVVKTVLVGCTVGVDAIVLFTKTLKM